MFQFVARGVAQERVHLRGVDSQTWSRTTHSVSDQPAKRFHVRGPPTFRSH